jgi:hypothetical protein
MSEYTDVMKQFPLDPKPDIPVFSEFIDLYYSKRGDREIPAWSDFRIRDFIGWHSNMALSQKENDDYRFRIFGTGFTELFADDFTGLLLCESMAPGHVQSSKKHFQCLVEGPKIGWVKGRVPVESRDYLPFEVIDLPLRNEVNEVVGFIHLLGVSN